MDDSKQITADEPADVAELKGAPSPVPAKRQARAPKDDHFLAWSVFNRDLSQLEFFKRVLEEAADESVPTLERLKFLAVFVSNLDEFFMVRVSGLKEMLAIKDIQPMPGELTPPEQLRAIRSRMLPMVEEQAKILHNQVLPDLAKNGVEIVGYKSLSTREKK